MKLHPQSAILVAFVLAALPSCRPLLDPPDECTPLAELCPTLACDDGFVQSDEGCPTCECAVLSHPDTVACWTSSECGSSETCDTVSYCDAAPGCGAGSGALASDGLAPSCPAVCYGRCVPAVGNDLCSRDTDCAPTDFCALPSVPDDRAAPGADAPARPTDAGTSLPAPPGICTPRATSPCDGLPPTACLANPNCEGIWSVADGAPLPPSAPGEDARPPPPPGFVCVAATPACAHLPVETCYDDARCRVVVPPQLPCIAPSDTPSCAQPPPYCAPRAGGPSQCQSDADCGFGARCDVVEVCTDCAAPPTDGDAGTSDAPGPISPLCTPTCSKNGQCISLKPCSDDAQCAVGEACVVPGLARDALVAPSAGFCEKGALTSGLCQSDAQCAPDEHCALEPPVCLANPDAPDTSCWSTCASSGPASTGVYCLDDSVCGDGGACVFHANVCLDDPNSPLEACSGWCVSACGDALTAAIDPVSGACTVFSDTCIPPGFRAVGGAACPE